MSQHADINHLTDDDEIIFLDELPPESVSPAIGTWKIVIADDDRSVHRTTQTLLDDISFDGKGFTYLNAYSGKETQTLLEEHPDTALILLDVVMETDHAGLDVVRYIREQLNNRFVRIILRTGQPGYAPEKKVIMDYDINDYKLKSMLTDQGLYTAVISALRTFKDLQIIEQNRKELAAAMERAEIATKARYQFLANMGHELRTPLHHILAFTDLLLDTGGFAPKQIEYIKKIRKAGKGLMDVIKNVLDLTELTEGKLVFEHTRFSLRELIREVMELVEIHAQWKKLQTLYEIEDGIPETHIGDPKHLKQVLMNMLINSVKYTETGYISLFVNRVMGDPNHLLFTLSDSGIGIPESIQQDIFTPFVIGEDVLTKKFSGAGLGLAISKEIIEKMGGYIMVDSRPQEGSTFLFTIHLKTE